MKCHDLSCSLPSVPTLDWLGRSTGQTGLSREKRRGKECCHKASGPGVSSPGVAGPESNLHRTRAGPPPSAAPVRCARPLRPAAPARTARRSRQFVHIMFQRRMSSLSGRLRPGSGLRSPPAKGAGSRAESGGKEAQRRRECAADAGTPPGCHRAADFGRIAVSPRPARTPRKSGAPKGNRTPVSGVRGRRPRPLDDGGAGLPRSGPRAPVCGGSRSDSAARRARQALPAPGFRRLPPSPAARPPPPSPPATFDGSAAAHGLS